MPSDTVHFELTGPDAASLGRFYPELFGWSVSAGRFPDYQSIAAAGLGLAGGAIQLGLFTQRARPL
jgi:predicted enzyme related to lactoylglutathione lyase